MHSDLKPANFLMVEGVLKLIDFGIAKAIQAGGRAGLAAILWRGSGAWWCSVLWWCKWGGGSGWLGH